MAAVEVTAQHKQNDVSLYDMTVVIPVYNKEDSLEECVTSLDDQTASQGAFEVILVNDGSVDNSLELCTQLASTRKNYTVIDQKNQGVSAARNAGLLAANGRYVMFLDSDDWISKESIANLVKAFDEYRDQVDLLTYPILYHSSTKDKGTEHRRRYWMKEGGVYDLSEYPFIAQTTVNVCVKSELARKTLFSTDLKMGEDQYFITSCLLQKGKIGFCDEASYHYIRSGGGSSSLGNYPLYAFDGMMKLFEFLHTNAIDRPELGDYLHSLILYNVGWRLRSGMLYPDFGDAETREANYDRLERLLKSIPLHCWLNNPYISDNLRLYFVNQYQQHLVSSIAYSEENTAIAFADSTTRNYRIPSLTIDWLVNKSDHLQVRGRLSGPSFIFEDKPSLCVEVNGGSVPIELKESSYSFDGTKTRITKAWYFETTLPNQCDSERLYAFAAQFGDRAIPALKLQFSTRRCNGRSVKAATIREFRDFSVTFTGNSLCLTPLRKLPPVLDQVSRFVRDARRIGHRKTVLPIRVRLPKALKKVSGIRTWIYVDNPSSLSTGNAFTQFLHDLKIDDGVNRLYLTARIDELLASYPYLSNNLLEFHSWEHVVFALHAELILASFIDKPTFMPHVKGITDRYADFAREQAYVYLQHGILHAHMPWYCSYDRTMFDFEVISTSFEEENLTKNYLFPSEALIQSGAPRLDALEYQGKPKQKKIAFIPSWRGYLVGGNSIKRVPRKEALLKSAFYKGMMGFLTELSKSGVLEDYDYTLDLKLHPNFKDYEDLFGLDNERIHLATDSFDESVYSVAITDYSSYLYDFVYSGARIMYFLPDEQEFQSGVNHYSSLDLPFEEGFGPYSSTPEDAVVKLRELISSIENGRGEEEYKARADAFFLHHDQKNSDRLYEELIRISSEYLKREY